MTMYVGTWGKRPWPMPMPDHAMDGLVYVGKDVYAEKYGRECAPRPVNAGL